MNGSDPSGSARTHRIVGSNPPGGFLPSRLVLGGPTLRWWLITKATEDQSQSSTKSRSNGRPILAGFGRSRNRATSSPDGTGDPCGAKKLQDDFRKESYPVSSGASPELKAT